MIKLVCDMLSQRQKFLIAGTLALVLVVYQSPGLCAEIAQPTAAIELLVNAKPKQQLLGFGASQPRDQSRLFSVYGPEKVQLLAKAVYGKLGMNWFRMWVAAGPDQTIATMKEKFYKGYIDNGYLDILRAAGVTSLLLAPARGEAAPIEPMQNYAKKIARFIYDIRRERGIQIDVTGIANEPAGFSPNQLNEVISYLRIELDSLGLSDVGIIAPECASPDACATKVIALMKSNSITWEGLRGIATHSYNMGANAAVEKLISGTGKEYWITEAGRGLPRFEDEQPGDIQEASSVAARFLNDMNHSVTHWFWFIGIGHFDRHPAKDSGQVLARPDDSTGGLKFNSKFHYLKQLRASFDLGAAFYEVNSVQEKRMNWGFGQKPAITAAMARNPNGEWGIGIVNTTGIKDSRIAKFYSAVVKLVSIKVPIEASNKKYELYRSNEHGAEEAGILYVDKSGYINVSIAPFELLTLRSM